jgi:hypothetical protein
VIFEKIMILSKKNISTTHEFSSIIGYRLETELYDVFKHIIVIDVEDVLSDKLTDVVLLHIWPVLWE